MVRSQKVNIMINPIYACLNFFHQAVPHPEPKNLNTQLGCHLEEVVEMMEEFVATSFSGAELLRGAKDAVHALAEHAKAGTDFEVPTDRRIGFLDALCDQLVTAIGCAHMCDMDIIGGFDETNRSNLSKFGEDGKPIFNENMKVMKGPNYTQSDLSAFV